MYTLKQVLKSTLFAGMAMAIVSCSDKDPVTPQPEPEEGAKVYALGLGVTTGSGASAVTTNYVVQTSDLMTGKISPVGNGLIQEGYRDYAFANSTLYSIGGLGVTDVNAIRVDESGKLTTKTGLTFELPNNQLVDVDGTGKTLLGVSIPAAPTGGDQIKLYTVNTASNSISNRGEVPVNDVYPTSEDWIFHSGIQVSGSKVYHTYYPVHPVTYETKNTDKQYVAVYSYPGFELEKVMTDDRTGPAGSFNMQSGLFKTESGDLYTVSTTSYGYSQSTKDAAILKIKAGTVEFDQDYYFNTDEAENGGKVSHAIYIGNGKLFAAVTIAKTEGVWSDDNLQLSIVDLNAKTITPVKNAPIYKGDGGRSFAVFLDEGKVYSAIPQNGVTHIYQTDVSTATATKGAQVEATFVGGIARLR